MEPVRGGGFSDLYRVLEIIEFPALQGGCGKEFVKRSCIILICMLKLLFVNPCSVLLIQGQSPGGGEVEMVNKYESIFIINNELGEENVKALVEKFKNLLETSAQLESIEEWGKRRLAYPIDDLNEGYYVLANFSAESNFPAELERIYKITDGIIKYIIVKKDK